MTLLALDTTAVVATAALLRDGELVLELEAQSERKHAETVVPLIDRLLEETGTRVEQIDLFAVDIGPGSFTGVRIGVSLVNAMAFALGKNVVPVSALFALYTALGEREKPVCALIDARNGNSYAALYRAGETLVQPCAAVTEDFLRRLPEGTRITGDAAGEKKVYPRASAVGFAALTLQSESARSVEPVYLRSSQAERMRARREKEKRA
ncbi:MAG TPA: tRNA (adenosine(37)-N6)-threonylcarbamoyltransferase complex dimerization subunit type 1 TsaB [Eubacteriales bacterium]|nr:tRNA (adenosine(37)-N6)-threonylcarbamoyltransferase complex dimerization subunit type 1 TsaB [Eubacteriales bacterium]